MNFKRFKSRRRVLQVARITIQDVPAAYLSVPLTTVRVPKREMGQQLEGPGRIPLARVTLEAELVGRGLRVR